MLVVSILLVQAWVPLLGLDRALRLSIRDYSSCDHHQAGPATGDSLGLDPRSLARLRFLLLQKSPGGELGAPTNLQVWQGFDRPLTS